MDIDANVRREPPAEAVFGHLIAPDGLRIRRMDWPQPPGAKVRGSLIFAGGRSDFIEKYLEAYRHWHGRGWNVTAFDWRGQGKSEAGLSGGNYESFDPLVEDFDVLIRDWRGEAPGPHVAVAHSMGGHLLLRTLAEKSPLLDAAALLAPMIEVNSAPLPSWLGRRLAFLFCRFGWKDRPVWKNPETPDPRRQMFLTSCPDRAADLVWWREREPGFHLGPPSWAWLCAAYRSAAAFTPERLEQVQLPVLLMGTETDRLVSPAAIRRVARLLPNAELVMFPDSGHEILREADPIRIDALARIDSFLAGRTA